MKPVAAIDVGTNTVLLTIAHLDDAGSIAPLVEDHEITRLGEGLHEHGDFSSAAMERTLAVLTRFADQCRAHDVAVTLAVGTAAFRLARNAADFVARIAAATGIRLDIISGDREAELSYRAAVHDFGADSLVLDIGGGSTELIWMSEGERRAFSLPLGSVTLLEQCLHSDPPAATDLAALDRQILATISQAPYPLPSEATSSVTLRRLIALAGTATTLGAMHRRLAVYSHADVHGTVLHRRDVEQLFTTLSTTTLAERRRLPGLEPKRADVILPGTMLLRVIMDTCGFDAVTVSDRGVRWGLLYERLAA